MGRPLTDPNRIVSSDSDELILVDELDNEIGYKSKAYCHDGSGLLHRAFSIFLFNAQGELLLQRRAREKRLWPGFWSNSCCSHPRRGESLATAIERRLGDELNVTADVEHVYHFCYQASFGEAGAEKELCHVFLGKLDGEARPNNSEIESVRLICVRDLDDELAHQAQRFTPWFKQEWRTLNADYGERLRSYAIKR